MEQRQVALKESDLLPHTLDTVKAELAIRRTADIVPIKTKAVALRAKPVPAVKVKTVATHRSVLPAFRIGVRIFMVMAILWAAGYAVGASALGQYVAVAVAVVAMIAFIGAPAVAWLLTSGLGSLVSWLFSGKSNSGCGSC